jgi:hypothetical protein
MPLLVVVTSYLTHEFEQRRVAQAPSAQQRGPQVVRYVIKGNVNLEEGQLDHDKVQVCLKPPDFKVDYKGHFEGKALLEVDEKGNLVDPPQLFFDSGRAGRVEPLVYILNEGEKAPEGVDDYDVRVTRDPPVVALRRTVEFPMHARGFPDPAAQEARPIREGGLRESKKGD